MIDYHKELERLDKHLTNKNYTTIIREIGYVFEMALKDLYTQQIEFFERNKNNKILNKEYKKLKEKQEKDFPDFNIDRVSFAQISWFFYKTNFNQLIELRVNSPLTFSNKIPWKEIRQLRNQITHTNKKVTDREIVLRFIDYLQVYLKETKLTESIVPVDEAHCYYCKIPIDRNWNFCPNCGVDLSLTCKNCGADLLPSWSVCPICSTPREGVKVENPQEIYMYYCQAVWSDGFLNREENKYLQRKQKELGLNEKVAKQIENQYAPVNAVRFRDMIESCMTDDHVDDKERSYLREKANELGIDHRLANSIFNSCLSDIINIPLFDE
jgi:RNA polymerase subunit RPABC4/transcription elongation factor Spt4